MSVALLLRGVSEEATLDAFADERAASVEPLAVTSSWSGDGECSACGESATRLWRDGGERVCTGCKSWNTTGSGARDQ
jgi:hypothetical protein